MPYLADTSARPGASKRKKPRTSTGLLRSRRPYPLVSPLHPEEVHSRGLANRISGHRNRAAPPVRAVRRGRRRPTVAGDVGDARRPRAVPARAIRTHPRPVKRTRLCRIADRRAPRHGNDMPMPRDPTVPVRATGRPARPVRAAGQAARPLRATCDPARPVPTTRLRPAEPVRTRPEVCRPVPARPQALRVRPLSHRRRTGHHRHRRHHERLHDSSPRLFRVGFRFVRTRVGRRNEKHPPCRDRQRPRGRAKWRRSDVSRIEGMTNRADETFKTDVCAV